MKNRKTTLEFILMTVLAVTVYAQQYDPESDFKVTHINDGKAIEITEYVGSKQTVRIPPTIQRLPVTTIGDGAFSRCTSLASITIGNSVTTIGSGDEGAFAYCTSLVNVTIPNSVSTIGGEAFISCTSLTEINVAANNANYSSDQGVLYNKNKTTLVVYPAGKKGSFTIPNSVAVIEYVAFSRCTGLTSVTIPNSVTTIGVRAFEFCKLTSVTIPNGVTTIENSAFMENQLTRVTIPNSVTIIEEGAFGGNNVTSVTIGANVEIEGMAGSHFGQRFVSGGDFQSVYNSQGRKAGTYTYSNNRWRLAQN